MKTGWRAYIHSNPEILTGKPVVKGTRLAVDFILGLFANGWTEQEVLESYPTLTPQALQAVFAFAAECMRKTSSTFIHFQHAQTGMFWTTARRLKPRATTCKVGLRRL
ncbi:MAG TPA: DUF433 domain-containing protein [Chloroflexi bacterium]|nr:DUF433 domain-containing protein [Chloroflexota bacterium]